MVVQPSVIHSIHACVVICVSQVTTSYTASHHDWPCSHINASAHSLSVPYALVHGVMCFMVVFVKMHVLMVVCSAGVFNFVLYAAAASNKSNVYLA